MGSREELVPSALGDGRAAGLEGQEDSTKNIRRSEGINGWNLLEKRNVW